MEKYSTKIDTRISVFFTVWHFAITKSLKSTNNAHTQSLWKWTKKRGKIKRKEGRKWGEKWWDCWELRKEGRKNDTRKRIDWRNIRVEDDWRIEWKLWERRIFDRMIIMLKGEQKRLQEKMREWVKETTSVRMHVHTYVHGSCCCFKTHTQRNHNNRNFY